MDMVDYQFFINLLVNHAKISSSNKDNLRDMKIYILFNDF